jgi:hypothetical protein
MPECNGCAERFIRTLKENLLWVRHFKTIEELRLALPEFTLYHQKSHCCTKIVLGLAKLNGWIVRSKCPPLLYKGVKMQS